MADSKTSGASYAIMIYDAKNNVFKLVPVEKHFKFEKCKFLPTFILLLFRNFK